jgi:outer membrane protein TolC
MNRFASLFCRLGHADAPLPESPISRLRFRHTVAAVAAALVIALAATGKVRADEPPLTLAEAQRLATLRSKQLEASDLAVSASRDLAIAAGERPDPIGKIGVENLPINGEDKFSVQRDFMTMRSIGIMQEITRPTKLHARAAESEQAVRLAEAQKLQSQVEVQRDVALAWLDRYYSEAQEQAVRQQTDVAHEDVAAADAGYRGGHGTAADVLTARAALAEAEDMEADATRMVRAAKLALARWVGEASERPVAGHPAFESIPLHKHALDSQLSQHPEILALQRREELARAGAEVARAERHPDWSVEFMYSQRGTGYSNMVTLELTVPLEIRRGYRQDRKLAAKLAEASQAKAAREDMLREHTAEISTMIDEWDSDRERGQRYHSSIVPLAVDRTAAARAAYRGGKATLNDLLLAQRAEIDIRLKALQLEASSARLWAQLTFLNSTPDMADLTTPTVVADRGELP